MTTETKQITKLRNDHTRVTALHDQAWATVQEFQADIKRIADNGPRSDECDSNITRMVFCAVAGDHLLAQSNQQLQEMEQ